MAQTIGEVVSGNVEDSAQAVVRWAIAAVALEPAVAGTPVARAEFWSGATTSGATSLTRSETITGSNLGACAIVWNAGSAAPTGVTWNSVALIKIVEVTIETWTLSIWVLTGADSGSHDFVASFGSSVASIIVAGGVTGLHQTTPTAGTASDSELLEEAAVSITVTSGTLVDGILLIGIAGNPNLIRANVSTDDVQLVLVSSGSAGARLDTSLQDITTKAPDTTGPGPLPPKFDEPPAGDPGAGAPDVGEARVPRREPVVRRGLRGRRGFKAGPPGHRGLPPVQGEQIDKRIPDEYEEPLVRKWLTFSWLARPMLEGQKTITLRDWGPTEGVQWQHGELFYAYDTPPVEGGRRLAILRVMQEPFVEFTARLRMADYHKLGYSYAMANRLMSPSGRTALQVWEDLHNKPQSLWLLRFAVERIFEQGRKERDTVQIAEKPPDVLTFGPTS
ncbi:hypothetical protein LCGC14_1194760 [marine sediment metagenome]|uniref:ASCH domain-containing protein n=1 Tax=marine sediment metagenome TaxID=412755 RepID=A0A0F9PNQ8_9ZZZZ